eukprot:jgi/Botrbrau1/14153/Bobra.182_3s0093.1
MCIAFFSFGTDRDLSLLLLFNRDEYFARGTRGMHWWEDAPHILGGRDLLAGGTWLAISLSGRFAFLTNYREVTAVAGARSRGRLPEDFLRGSDSPLAYLSLLDPQAYNGFNLVVGDAMSQEVAYLSNRGEKAGKPQVLRPGLHGLSNGTLYDSWPKVETGLRLLQEKLENRVEEQHQEVAWEELFQGVLGHCQRVEDEDLLPRTGISLEMEKQYSSIFIPACLRDGELYGTRSQTGIAVWRDGHVDVRERTLSPQGQVVDEQLFTFELRRTSDGLGAAESNHFESP